MSWARRGSSIPAFVLNTDPIFSFHNKAMARVCDILDALERLAPRRHALAGDKVGLQVGDPDAEVSKVVVSLDRSLGAVNYAIAEGAQMLLTHHPLIFSPIETVHTGTLEGRTVLKLAKHGIAFAAAHTNWDAAHGGVNDTLAQRLQLRNVHRFGEAAEVSYLKLVFFCPPNAVERVLDAVSEAGAGVIGNYSRCAFLSAGQGTFVGNEASNPTVGEPGRKETIEEARVETIFPAARAKEVRKALLATHPYEEPSYDFMVLTPAEELPLGRIGELGSPMPLQEFVEFVDRCLGARSLAWGDPNRVIHKVAAVGGSADGEWLHAKAAGADVLVTGEVRQHVALEVTESGFAILSAGHYATENPGAFALGEVLAKEVPDVDFVPYEPNPGMAGRPFYSR